MERQSHYTSGKKNFLGPKILGKSYLLSNFLEIFHIAKQILHTGKKKNKLSLPFAKIVLMQTNHNDNKFNLKHSLIDESIDQK